MRIRARWAITTLVVAASVPAVAPATAHADLYSCAFNTPFGYVYTGRSDEYGIESIDTDLHQPAFPNQPMGDNDDEGAAGYDGDFNFYTPPVPFGGIATCLFVESTHGSNEGLNNLSGVYRAYIGSAGKYDNLVCGTATFFDRGSIDLTTVTFERGALGDAAEINDMDYSLGTIASQGTLDITNVTTMDGETSGTVGDTDGYVSIVPTGTGSGSGDTACVDGDVDEFQAFGTFTIVTG
jgi:hypothetical protein